MLILHSLLSELKDELQPSNNSSKITDNKELLIVGRIYSNSICHFYY